MQRYGGPGREVLLKWVLWINRMAVVGISAVPLALDVPAEAMDLTCPTIFPALPGRRAPDPGFQAGIGIQASVRPGKAVVGKRVGHRVAFFAEMAPVCYGKTLVRPVGGLEVASRKSPGDGSRLEVLARGGAGALWGWGGYHLNLATGHAAIGFARSKDSGFTLLGGAGARGPGLLARVMVTTGETGDTHLDLGAEVGLSPPFYFIEHGRPARDDTGGRAAIDAGPGGAVSRWRERARDELEAVAAFLNLAAELAELGAPTELIARCRLAAEDEARHAAVCFGRAAELSGVAVKGQPLRAKTRSFGTHREGLITLARESLVDGYVNEGAAVRALLDEARQAGPRDAVLLRRIATEEQSHSLLGLDVARWCAAEAA